MKKRSTKYTEKEVNDILQEHGCTLVGSYKNNITKITMLCSCNHERITTLSRWKSYKQYLCKQCSQCTQQKNRMHPKTFQSRLNLMNYLLTRNKKYRNDFMAENYNKTIICCLCKLEKPIYLFGQDKRKINGKMSYCKLCDVQKGRERRENQTQIQFMKCILKSCRASTKRRTKIGRVNMYFNITLQDIKNLVIAQNNKCAYSGVELFWNSNHKNTASVDRIDSTIGYIPSNIQLVTKSVNQAKSNFTEMEFWNLIRDCYHTMSMKINKKSQLWDLNP